MIRINILNKLNWILFEDWDPININSNINLLDEYKNYAVEFCTNQKKYASNVMDIYNKLLYYEENEIGVKVKDQIRQKVSSKIYKSLIENGIQD